MDQADLRAALKGVSAEKDPALKHLLLAALCTRLFGERGIRLVVVGGSAIEFYTEGAYVSGDLDLCTREGNRLGLRDRQELMGMLKAKGGPRSWEVAGSFVDLLGEFEGFGKTKFRRIATDFGEVEIAPAEELLVERALVAVYPTKYPPALDCARKLIAAGLRKEIEMDWSEVARLAKLPEYGNEKDVKTLVTREAKALAIRSPYHSGRGRDAI